MNLQIWRSSNKFELEVTEKHVPLDAIMHFLGERHALCCHATPVSDRSWVLPVISNFDAHFAWLN